ncbi:MAG: caspase family protein [Proteobacteria bacterium]|nr:caspase family protein [Pseudomonadota bacterium]
MSSPRHTPKNKVCAALLGLTVAMVAGAAGGKEAPELVARAQIAAANLADAVVVDCQLPGRLQQLGGMRTYMTPGVLTRLAAIDCRTRGGEYTVGDLASGTLSLARWLPLAEKGDNVEAQYYVARIYANGMDNVPVDYAKAAEWYQRAAKKKFQPAMQELGYLYEQGLGVPKDPLMGLNLQREASGLGEQLDYAAKIAANEQQNAQLVSALIGQLNSANGTVEDLRGELDQANDRLAADTAQINRERSRLADLHRQLDVARQEGTGPNTAKVQQLQEQLAAAEKEVAQKQEAIGTLNAQLAVQQTQMSEELARTQAANAKLNDLVASNRDDAAALRVRLAQSEQRLNESQHELGNLRATYLQETTALAARSEQVQRLRAQGTDNFQSLLSAKEGELQQQRVEIDSLQKQVAAMRQQSTQAGAGAASAANRADSLQKSLDSLRAQYDSQQKVLEAQRAESLRVQTMSKDEKAALAAQMATQLAAKAAQLEASQKRLTALQSESDQLREAVAHERTARAQDVAQASGAADRDRAALREAQGKVDQQRTALEKLQMQLAASQLELVQAREHFGQQSSTAAQQASAATQAAQKRVAELEADVRAKDKQITDLRFELAKAGEPAARPVPVAAVRPAPTVISEPDALIRMVRSLGTANYHALIIGNGKYAHMPALPTPVNDAKDVGELLKTRYGFDVKLLTDVTADDIMKAINEYARTLNDSDRLLIYYAGHGDTKIFPPERAFWLGTDADPELPSTWLSAQTVADAISMIHARHILLVADSCFSSAITHVASTTVVRLDDERSTAIRWNKAARMVLTSGENEPATDARVPDPSHSMFAYLFIAALRQNNILMSGEMLAHELNNRLAIYPGRAGAKPAATYSNLQDPQHKFGDFFFVPVARGTQLAALTP